MNSTRLNLTSDILRPIESVFPRIILSTARNFCTPYPSPSPSLSLHPEQKDRFIADGSGELLECERDGSKQPRGKAQRRNRRRSVEESIDDNNLCFYSARYIYIFFIFTKVFRVEYFVLRYCSDFFFSFSLFPFLSGEKAIRKLEGGW